MASVYEFINNNYRVWDSCKLLDAGTIDVTEIWVHDTSQRMHTVQRQISTSHIEGWLDQTSENGRNTESTMLLRLVWVEFQHMENIQHIPPNALNRLLSLFRIEVAYEWNWTCFAGSTRFSHTNNFDEPIICYSACNHPKVATAWSYNISTGLTQGIYFAPSGQIPELQNLVQALAVIAGHPMLPAFIFGISLSGLIDQDHKMIKEKVRAVEVRTKFHSWASRNEAPAEGDYISLSAMTAGAKTRIANLCRRTRVLYALCDFIEENLHPIDVNGVKHYNTIRVSNMDVVARAEEYTQLLKKRTALQEADAQFFQHRADIQLQSLSNLIAQRQATTNLDIASATRQDSLSLKTLSLVTMFFLPGTFLATLFSIPFLDWSSEKKQGGGFWVYWVFAVPLTLTTFGVWWIWTYILEKKYKV